MGTDSGSWYAGRRRIDEVVHLPGLGSGRLTVALASAAFVVAVAAATATDQLLALLAGAVIMLLVMAALRWPVVLLYAFAAAVPFNAVIPPGPIGTVGRGVGIVFVVGYLLLRFRVLRPSVVPVAGWAFVGWALITALWAPDGATALNAWWSLAQLFAVMVVVASVIADDDRQVMAAMWAYSAAAAVTAVIATVNYLQSSTLFLSRATAFEDLDPALFASSLLPAALFFFSRAGGSRTDPILRLLAVAGLTICCVALGLSGTRSAWLGGAAGVAVLVWARSGRRAAPGIIVVVGALVALSVFVPGASDFLLERTGTAISSGGAGRTDIWAVGLSIASSAPLQGVGFAGFPAVFTAQAISDAGFAASAAGELVAGRGPHDILLAILVETGIVGLTLFVWTIWDALARVCRSEAGNVVRAMLIGLMVQALFVDILLQKQTWLVLGLAFGLGVAGRLRGMDAVPGNPASSATRLRAVG